MKSVEVDIPENSLPMNLPHGVEATCLDRSLRGGGRHGVFLLKSSESCWVVKIYHHKRDPYQRFFSGLENYFAGRSSPGPRARFNTEKKTLEIWQKNGFEVFRRLTQPPPVAINFPHLVFEYVPGRTLKEYFLDSAIGKIDKINTFKRFLPEWSRRHALALETENHYLIQERATLQHVFMSSEDDRLIFYDFEIAYTPRHKMPAIIAREIAGYVRSLFSAVPRDDFNEYLDILIRDYPNRDFLGYPYDYFFRHPNRLLRLVYIFDRQLPRNRRPRSKYNIALRIQDGMQKNG
jgi:hypothetical protein